MKFYMDVTVDSQNKISVSREHGIPLDGDQIEMFIDFPSTWDSYEDRKLFVSTNGVTVWSVKIDNNNHATIPPYMVQEGFMYLMIRGFASESCEVSIDTDGDFIVDSDHGSDTYSKYDSVNGDFYVSDRNPNLRDAFVFFNGSDFIMSDEITKGSYKQYQPNSTSPYNPTGSLQAILFDEPIMIGGRHAKQ